jgi:hypothetical protein
LAKPTAKALTTKAHEGNTKEQQRHKPARTNTNFNDLRAEKSEGSKWVG